ncbi:hypothetical protein D3C85_980730 [compost metagenome]
MTDQLAALVMYRKLITGPCVSKTLGDAWYVILHLFRHARRTLKLIVLSVPLTPATVPE